MSVYDLPEWHALMCAIRADKSNDLPRLVAADWLDEVGEHARAEFIRLQIGGASCNDICELLLREQSRSTLRNHGHWGLPDIAQIESEANIIVLGPASGFTAQVRRGFVSEVKCTSSQWSSWGIAIAEAGALTKVELTDISLERLLTPARDVYCAQPIEWAENRIAKFKELRQLAQQADQRVKDADAHRPL
jgi:uncharacterized protein (TIGR02996 family)